MASGGGDDRQQTGGAPSGKYVFVFQANGALENLSQDAASDGGAGDTYTVTLLAAGQGLTVGECCWRSDPPTEAQRNRSYPELQYGQKVGQEFNASSKSELLSFGKLPTLRE